MAYKKISLQQRVSAVFLRCMGTPVPFPLHSRESQAAAVYKSQRYISPVGCIQSQLKSDVNPNLQVVQEKLEHSPVSSYTKWFPTMINEWQPHAQKGPGLKKLFTTRLPEAISSSSCSLAWFKSAQLCHMYCIWREGAWLESAKSSYCWQHPE